MIPPKRSPPTLRILSSPSSPAAPTSSGLIKDHAALPERLLDINHLPDMARIDALPNGDLRIGALARMSDVAAHPEVRARFPVIAEALLFAASGQLRNMASIGGNIMQRTRCAYFRDEDGPPLQQAAPWLGLLGSPRHQSQSRHLRVVGRLRRHQCVRSGGGVRRPRRQSRRPQPQWGAIDSVHRFPSPARRDAGTRQSSSIEAI